MIELQQTHDNAVMNPHFYFFIVLHQWRYGTNREDHYPHGSFFSALHLVNGLDNLFENEAAIVYRRE